jgi:hypothetical protein
VLRIASFFVCVSLLVGCSGQKTLTPDDLRSKAADVSSLAAEGELFCDFISAGHATSAYISGHTEYLQKLAEKSAQELAESNVPADLEPSLVRLRNDSDELKSALSTARSAAHDPAALSKVHDRFSAVHRSAEQVRHSQ